MCTLGTLPRPLGLYSALQGLCGAVLPAAHLDLLLHEEALHQLAVPLVQAGVVQPDAELQRVHQVRVLQSKQHSLCSEMHVKASLTLE